MCKMQLSLNLLKIKERYVVHKPTYHAHIATSSDVGPEVCSKSKNKTLSVCLMKRAVNRMAVNTRPINTLKDKKNIRTMKHGRLIQMFESKSPKLEVRSMYASNTTPMLTEK